MRCGHFAVRVVVSALLVVTLLGLGLWPGRPPAAHAGTTVYVDRTDDYDISACTAVPGDCTLRGAIEYANANGTFNNIRFDYGIDRIYLTQALPAIASEGTWIDGSDPDGNPIYPIIDGAAIAADYGPIQIQASHVTLSHLSIVNMPPNGADIAVESASVVDTRIAYNDIGVYPSPVSCGSAGLVRSGYSGVRVAGGWSGGPGAGNGSAYIYGNVIGCHSASGDDGIEVVDANWVYIGKDPSGLDVPNFIGLTPADAPIGNAKGVAFVSYSHTDPMSSTLGSDTIAYNTEAGVDIAFTDTNGIRILGTVIHDNGGPGIQERYGAHGAIWSHLSMYNNGGLGIDIKANGRLDGSVPVFTSVNPSTGLISGLAFPSSPPAWQVTVEVYRVAPDPSGYGEGRTYVGTAQVDTGGNWSMTDPSPTGCYTAFQSVWYAGTWGSFSSEFGQNNCMVFLPVLERGP